jgi:cysteinyl-tRNA synthetase
MIIKFIEKLIKNGDAYESNSSVYFDTKKFHPHTYAKSEADQISDVAELSENRGALTTAENPSKEKKNESDFVLWKKTKAGQLAWQSSWGLGRPVSNIGCIFMECTTLGMILFYE